MAVHILKERSIFQTFWKHDSCPIFVFFELKTWLLTYFSSLLNCAKFEPDWTNLINRHLRASPFWFFDSINPPNVKGGTMKNMRKPNLTCPASNTSSSQSPSNLFRDFWWQKKIILGWHFHWFPTYCISSYSFHTLVSKLFKFSLQMRNNNAETIWILQGFTISKKIVADMMIYGI